ncbi:MAG: cell division protein FtsZ [Candidatus Pacebacteria bacterium]|nr:cell division protein FtsZ [Candidatus Paceibacterota bacterium]
MSNNLTKIKVIGIGGAGCNTIHRLYSTGVSIDFISLNTDIQDLQKKKSTKKIRIGKKATRGLGAGMHPEMGKLSAEENRADIEEAIIGTDILFITAGLGGGTGSGAMPIVAEIAKANNILTIGVVTLPFSFEGKKRKKVAMDALSEVEKNIDTLVVIPNDKLLEIIPQEATIESAFEKCDELLKEAVESISNVVLNPGILNLDFSDIKRVLKEGGAAFFGVGKAKGENRAVEATKIALSSQITRFPLQKAEGILFNVTSGENNFSLSEVKQVSALVKEKTSPSTKIIFGASFDNNLTKDEIRVTIIATSANIDN